MRARFLEAEPAPAGWPPLRVLQPRAPRSRTATKRLKAGSAGSAVLHLALLAVLLLQHGREAREEEPSAPSFAVDFVDAAQPAPSASASRPQVNIFGEDVPPPPPVPEHAEDEPSVPLFHYGSALHPKRSTNPFANIVPFDLHPHESTRSASRGATRGLDLSAGPVVRDGRLVDAIKHQAGRFGWADWLRQLHDFVEDHGYYPRAAGEAGEQGSVLLRLTITRDGTVKDVQKISSSGSEQLDAAGMAIFRNNKVPPFGDDVTQNEITVNFTLDYELIYAH